MGADGHLNFDTKLDEKGFSSGVSKIGGIAKSGLAVLGGAVAGVAAAMGAGVVAGVKYNAGIEQYQTSFEVMTGSADKASEVIERLKKVGAETPFELNDLADTTQLLMNYGFTADDAMDRMMMLGDISQGSADKMNRIATAYGQMSSAGKVQLEDVKQMIEAGFNPLQEISESTGESMSSLYDRISKGTLSVDEITESMTRATSEGGKYFQSMDKQSQTVNGMISTLKDNAQQLLGEVIKPITESFAKDLLPGAIDAIDQLTTAFKENGVDGLIEAGGQIITNLLLGITDALPGVIDTAIRIIQSLLTALIENAPQITSAAVQIVTTLINGLMETLPMLLELGMSVITNLISGIGQALPQLIPAAVSTILQLVDNFYKSMPQMIDAGMQLLLGLAQGIVDSIPILISMVPQIIETFLAYIISALPKILETGVEILVMLINGIVDAIPQLIAAVPQIISAIVNAIISSLPQIISSGIKIIGSLVAGLIKAIPSIVGAIPKIISSIVNAFKNTNWGDVGKNIIKGVANGIVGAAGAIVDAAKSAAKKALDGAKKFLGIHSPSTVFRDEVGKYMAKGMGIGFEKNVPVDDMEKSIDRAVGKVHGAVGRISSNTDIAMSYPAAPIGDTSSQDNTVPVVINNTFQVDGEKLVEKTTKAVVKKVSKDQKSERRVKG